MQRAPDATSRPPESADTTALVAPGSVVVGNVVPPPCPRPPPGFEWIDTLTLTIWLVLQLAAAALALLHVPLSASYPPAGRAGLHALLCVDFVGASLLAPLLMRRVATAAVGLAAAWPILLVVGLNAAYAPAACLRAGIAVGCWWVALFAATQLSSSVVVRQIVAAVAAVLTLSGLLLNYLALEFQPPAHTVVTGTIAVDLAGWTPVSAAFSALQSPRSLGSLAVLAACLSLLLLAVRLLNSRRTERLRPSPSTATAYRA